MQVGGTKPHPKNLCLAPSWQPHAFWCAQRSQASWEGRSPAFCSQARSPAHCSLLPFRARAAQRAVRVSSTSCRPPTSLFSLRGDFFPMDDSQQNKNHHPVYYLLWFQVLFLKEFKTAGRLSPVQTIRAITLTNGAAFRSFGAHANTLTRAKRIAVHPVWAELPQGSLPPAFGSRSGPHCLKSHVRTHTLPISLGVPAMEQHWEDQQLGFRAQPWGNKESVHSGLFCLLKVRVLPVPSLQRRPSSEKSS